MPPEPVDPLVDPTGGDFGGNPYSCDWRADKTHTRANRLRFWAKAVALVAQACAYVWYITSSGCGSLGCALCLVYGVVFYARVLCVGQLRPLA